MVSFFEEREKGRKKEIKGEREKIDWFDIPLQPWKNDVDPLIGFPANRVRPLSLVLDPATSSIKFLETRISPAFCVLGMENPIGKGRRDNGMKVEIWHYWNNENDVSVSK